MSVTLTSDAAMEEAIARRMLSQDECWDSNTAEQREEDLRTVRWWLDLLRSAGYAAVLAAPPSGPRPAITRGELLEVRHALRGPSFLRILAERPAHAASAALLREVLGARPPLHHLVPVLALARAMAALVLLFGDPALIDAVTAVVRERGRG